jgi:hypothetical protein
MAPLDAGLCCRALQVAGVNGIGRGDWSTVVHNAVPMQVPGAPENIQLGVVSGTTLSVSFYEAEDGNSDVTAYIVQWDALPSFNSAAGLPIGTTTLSGSSIAVAQPFRYAISGLTEGTTLYVRMYARNAVPFQDNIVYGYSVPAYATTVNLPPLAPSSLTLTQYTGTSVQLRIGVPLGNGGAAIT